MALPLFDGALHDKSIAVLSTVVDTVPTWEGEEKVVSAIKIDENFN